MGTDRCDCRDGIDELATAADPTHRGLITDERVLAAELPSDLGSTLGRFLGRAPVAPLADWGQEIRDRTAGDARTDELLEKPSE